jgi:hypothetical protein
MVKRHTLRFLCPMMLYFFSAIQASATDVWEEDFSGGSDVSIATGFVARSQFCLPALE